MTLGAGSLSGLPYVHARFDLPLPGFLHVSTPHFYGEAPEDMSEREFADSLVRELDARIEAEGPETVAAFIAEPVMGAGGVLVPPSGYFEGVREVLREHDVLFIADEVICGFGRLGPQPKMASSPFVFRTSASSIPLFLSGCSMISMRC